MINDIGKRFQKEMCLVQPLKMTDEKRAELRKRAKEIGVKGIIQNFSDAVLVQKVTEKEAAFVENQNV